MKKCGKTVNIMFVIINKLMAIFRKFSIDKGQKVLMFSQKKVHESSAVLFTLKSTFQKFIKLKNIIDIMIVLQNWNHCASLLLLYYLKHNRLSSSQTKIKVNTSFHSMSHQDRYIINICKKILNFNTK